MPKTIPIPPYAPDVSDLGTATSVDVLNVVPRADGYGPFQDLESFTQALPAACRGYFFARRSDGSIAVFAGTATELYLLDNSTFEWAVVSKATYGALPTTDNWQFAQYNDLVIAVQVNTVPQKYDLTSSTLFEDLGGSPPQAGSIAIVGFFVMLTQLLSDSRRVHWSDLGAPETWTAGVGLCDFQDLPDGGSTVGISGGDAFGLVFQESKIRSLTYAPGSAAIFQITVLSTDEALYGKYSIINIGDMTFYCGAAGFKMIKGSSAPVAIGKEIVDRTFFDDVDTSNLQLFIGSSDPTTTRVYWAYKSGQGAAGLFDKILSYDWALKLWAPLQMSGEYIATLAKPGLTLEALDAIAPGRIDVVGAAAGGGGRIRLELTEISNSFYSIAGQNFIVVQGIDPAYMNGTWVPIIIDSTHIELTGSTFGAAYVSGGHIGGSLDALPFSLDSISKASSAELSAFGPTNILGFFNGPNLEATMETAEVDGEGVMLFTTGTRLICDSAVIYVSTGYRNSPSAVLSYTPEEVTDDTGWAPQLIESRYQRERIRVPAGSSWTYCRGVQPDGKAGGKR